MCKSIAMTAENEMFFRQYFIFTKGLFVSSGSSGHYPFSLLLVIYLSLCQVCINMINWLLHQLYFSININYMHSNLNCYKNIKQEYMGGWNTFSHKDLVYLVRLAKAHLTGSWWTVSILTLEAGSIGSYDQEEYSFLEDLGSGWRTFGAAGGLLERLEDW